MHTSYPAKYHDKYREEITTIQNDGRTLRMVVRGVEFSGTAFDLLDPSADCDKSKLEQFTFFLGALYGCEIDFDIPVLVVDHDQIIEGALRVHIELGEPDNSCPFHMMRRKENGILLESDSAPSREVLQLELAFGQKFSNRVGKIFMPVSTNSYRK